MLKINLAAIICALLICNSPSVNADAITIDHNNIDISQIPVAAIEKAKATLHIAYGHTSHGSQLISGMGESGTELDLFLNNSQKYNSSISGIYPDLYTWNCGGANGALDLHNYAMEGDVGYYPDWVNNTTAYLNDPANADVNVIIWSWCGQASWYTEQNMLDRYLAPMNQLEQKYPDVTFVYMTGHLDGSGKTGNLHLRNEQIRQYCQLNNKVLYDFADIESYDPIGLVNYLELNANDNCDYDSDNNDTLDSNWAISWQNSHFEDFDWWPSGAAHSQHLNGNLKGFAAWWLWASLAGWDNTNNATHANIYGNATYNGTPVCALVLANGQYQFTCSGDGSFSLDVPLDSNGQITVFSFCSGLAPYKEVIYPSTGKNMQIQMETGGNGTEMDVSYRVSEGVTNSSWVRLTGNIIYNGSPVCAMALANGQHMFTCSGDGSFDLEVPLDDNGDVTLFGFCSGLPPYKEVFSVN